MTVEQRNFQSRKDDPKRRVLFELSLLAWATHDRSVIPNLFRDPLELIVLLGEIPKQVRDDALMMVPDDLECLCDISMLTRHLNEFIEWQSSRLTAMVCGR